MGDLNGDRRVDTILDAELAGLNVLNQLLIQRGFGDRARVSVISFGSRISKELNARCRRIHI